MANTPFSILARIGFTLTKACYHAGRFGVKSVLVAKRHPRLTLAGAAAIAAGIGAYQITKPAPKQPRPAIVKKDKAVRVAIPEVKPTAAELVTVYSASQPQGKVLIDTENNGDKERPIASITKLVTFLLLAEKIKQGEITWDQTFPFPKGAVNAPKTALKIAGGLKVSVQDMAGLMMFHSDNGAALALAILVGGSKENFLKMMHAKTRALGLGKFRFVSPNGYYVKRQGRKIENFGTPRQVTALLNHIEKNYGPQLNHIYKMDHKFRGQPYHAHTRLARCGDNPNLHFKTGYTQAAGASLIAGITDPKDPSWKAYVFVGGATGRRHPGAPRDARALKLIADAMKKEGRSLKDSLKYSAGGPYCGRFTAQYKQLTLN